MVDDNNRLSLVPDREPSADDLGKLSDDDLMLVAIEGVHAAFEILVRRYQPLVLGTSTRFLGDPQLAREVTQDVFLALWHERERFQARGKFKSFLLRRTFNRAHVAARSRRNLRNRIEAYDKREESRPQAPTTPVDKLLADARAREVRELLSRVSAPIREALVLRYLHDMSLQEVAEVMGKPVGTIKSYVSRGLRRLQEQTTREAS